MHIAIFLPSLAGGGAERSLLKTGAGIAAHGHKVDIVLARAQGPYMAEVPGAVQVVNLNTQRDILSLPGLIRYLQHNKPDVLLSGLHTNLIAIWAKHLARIPTKVIVSERNTISQTTRHYAKDIRMRFLPVLIKLFYPRADCILAVSHAVADDLAQIGRFPGDKIQVIYNPIITPELKAKALDIIDHPWFAPGEIPVILGVGRLTAQKDFSTLINAFAIVKNEIPSRLLILGEGFERTLLEELCSSLGLKNDVSLPGFVINPYPYMAQASVFVLSSKWEGLPGVLIEAAYCGAPLVATDCPGGSREILMDGLYGQLVPIGDPETLAEAIIGALKHKTPPPEASWRPFEQEYVIDQYIQLLTSL